MAAKVRWGIEENNDLAKAIIMDAKDNVATLLADVDANQIVEVASTSGVVMIEVKSKQRIPFGHKISISELHVGQKVIKYGEVIGEATTPIRKGEHVHIHNVRSMTWGKFH